MSPHFILSVPWMRRVYGWRGWRVDVWLVAEYLSQPIRRLTMAILAFLASAGPLFAALVQSQGGFDIGGLRIVELTPTAAALLLYVMYRDERKRADVVEKAHVEERAAMQEKLMEMHRRTVATVEELSKVMQGLRDSSFCPFRGGEKD